MMMRLISPRRTAPYQTLDSSSRTTSPSTVAPGTTHALEWMVGPCCSRGTMPSCPVGNESGSICIRDERQDGTRSAPSQGYWRARFMEPRHPAAIGIFLSSDLGDYTRQMPELPLEQVTPFVFSDPTGKRWPRLRLILLIGGVLFFLATVLFVQTLFVAPKMNVPFSLRQLKGQLKALQKQNPAGST